MPEIERPVFNVSLGFIFWLIALFCFAAGFAVAQAWLTKGTVWEWAFAGFIASTLAGRL